MINFQFKIDKAPIIREFKINNWKWVLAPKFNRKVEFNIFKIRPYHLIIKKLSQILI